MSRELRQEPADAPAGSRLVTEYSRLLVERKAHCGEGLGRIEDEARDYDPPRGAWLVAYEGDEAVGCAGIRLLDERTAELKRMFVAERARGRGHGRALLEAMEAEARGRGYEVLRLDTASVLAEALSLYRSAGYVEIDDYNASPDPDIWMEKRL